MNYWLNGLKYYDEFINRWQSYPDVQPIMQINGHNNLPITTGYDRAQRQPQATADSDREPRRDLNPAPIANQIVQSQFAPATLYPRSVRPALNAQPMFNQQLTQSGEQARQAYQDTALAGEAELANRLDVIV